MSAYVPYFITKFVVHDVGQMEQRMRVDQILDSMPEGAQSIQPIDEAVILDLAREKLTIMRLSHRQRVFEFHSQLQQSKSVSGLRESVIANFPQILKLCVFSCILKRLFTVIAQVISFRQ
jgi:hypothetical protein